MLMKGEPGRDRERIRGSEMDIHKNWGRKREKERERRRWPHLSHHNVI